MHAYVKLLREEIGDFDSIGPTLHKQLEILSNVMALKTCLGNILLEKLGSILTVVFWSFSQVLGISLS